MRSLARHVEYGLVGGAISYAVEMFAYIDPRFSSSSNDFLRYRDADSYLSGLPVYSNFATSRLAESVASGKVVSVW